MLFLHTELIKLVEKVFILLVMLNIVDGKILMLVHDIQSTILLMK